MDTKFNNAIIIMDIPVFLCQTDVSCLEEGKQYLVDEWLLDDMKQFNGLWAFIGDDASLTIYNNTGDVVFENSFLKSADFRKKLMEKIDDYQKFEES